MARRTAQELWDALDEATLEAEIESALAMTPEERRQALVADGYDIDALHAQADAFFASLPEKVAAAASPAAPPAASPTAASKEPSEPVRPRAPVVPIPVKRGWGTWLLAVAAVAVVGIGIKAALPTPPVSRARPPKEYVSRLRDAAQHDCDEKRFEPCRQRLDEAAWVDGAGEGEPRVVKMRGAIEAGLAPGSGDAH